jgi:hypothetical protein
MKGITNMSIDPLFLPAPLRNNADEVLKAQGLEKDQNGNVYDPLHPSKTIALDQSNIICGSLKIEPYRPRKISTKIQLVANYKRIHEEILTQTITCSTLTPGAFLKSLPCQYLYIGSSNAPTQIQIIQIDPEITNETYLKIKNLRVKKTTFCVCITMRVIHRQLVEESCVVG